MNMKVPLMIKVEGEEELEFYGLSALYMLFKSSYSYIYRVRARSTAPIHETYILRPHPTDDARKIVSLLKDTPHPV